MKLPYGVLAENVVHISEVQSGRTDVQCPYCGKGLVAKKGKIKRHHFAHDGKSCMASFNNNLFSIQGKLPLQLPLFRFAARKTQAIQNSMASLNQQYDNVQEKKKTEEKLLPELLDYLERLEQFYLKKKMNLKASQIQDIFLQVKKYTSQKIAAFPDFQLIRGIPFIKTYTDGKHTCTLDQLEQDMTHYYYPSFFHKYVQCLKNYHSVKASAPELIANKTLFEKELFYFKQFDLYFLEVQTERGVFHKIGLTSRSIQIRLKEITQDLKGYYETVQLNILCLKKNHAFLETFFKQKYSTYQMKIGPLTEYFQFTPPLLSNILLDLELVNSKTIPNRDTALWAYWAYHKSNHKLYGYGKKSIYVEGEKIILSEIEEGFLKEMMNEK